MLENTLICIVGPTASGKTELSIKIAKYINAEIISADSMQIYKGLDIATAKPTEKEKQGIVHHMLDICEQDEDFSVAKYVKMADEIAQNILSKNIVPIVVGGTGLYIDSLIECNKFCESETDENLRNELYTYAKIYGNEALHKRLENVDKISAARLHPNNKKRIIRALEVFYKTGMTIDEVNKSNKNEKAKYKAIKIGICPEDRNQLYDRINKRVDIMVDKGLLNEVKKIYEIGNLSLTASQAIGYKEIKPYLDGEKSFDECIELLKQRSRNYAKRQITWFKRDKSIHWINYNDDCNIDDVFHSSTKILHDCGL